MKENGCKLMFYKFLTVEEMHAAVDTLNWFAEEAMSGKTRWNSKKEEWVVDSNLPLPSWRHLTRGGHKTGLNIQRGALGIYVKGDKRNKSAWENLIFRRHGRSQRIFVVQRIDDLDVPLDLKFRMDKRECVCKECVGDVKVNSKLTMDDLQLYREL